MTRILVPPGIGDIYWVLVKLKSFLKNNNLSNPELTVVSYTDEFNAHLRSVEFLRMFPWVTIGNPASVPNEAGLQHIWDEAYSGPGQSIFPGIMGYDYFIAYNGRINSGGWIEADEYECDWYPAMTPIVPVDAIGFVKNFMICFFPFYGTFGSHEAEFPIPHIAEVINQFAESKQLTPVFLGAPWENVINPRLPELLNLVPNHINLVGRTNLEEAFAICMGSEIVFGYHSGLTNMAAAFHKPTLLLWDNRYPASTAYACVPPNVRHKSYQAMDTNGMTVERLLGALCALHETYTLPANE
jgi:hypothetical protein